MQPVSYADPKFNGHGFWNHVHHVVVQSGVIPGTTEPLIELYKIDLVQNLQSSDGGGGKPRNIALFVRQVPSGGTMLSGEWKLIKMWEEGKDYDDSSSAASVAVHPNTGNVHVILSFGMRTAEGKIVFRECEEMIQRSSFAAPIVRPPELHKMYLPAV
jgi:hypothetical protein